MTESLTHPEYGQPWTIDDLARLPDDGMRYEIVDGSLLVSPQAFLRHARVGNRLRRLLDGQAPEGMEMLQDAGVTLQRRRSYFVPDIVLVRSAALDKDADYLDQGDVLLVVEVLSPSNPGNDLVLKRHYYATGGIRHYWVVDPVQRTLTVLELDGDSYTERTVVGPGQVLESDQPFPVRLDPADFL